jgi:hypothetical protein
MFHHLFFKDECLKVYLQYFPLRNIGLLDESHLQFQLFLIEKSVGSEDDEYSRRSLQHLYLCYILTRV